MHNTLLCNGLQINEKLMIRIRYALMNFRWCFFARLWSTIGASMVPEPLTFAGRAPSDFLRLRKASYSSRHGSSRASTCLTLSVFVQFQERYPMP